MADHDSSSPSPNRQTPTPSGSEPPNGSPPSSGPNPASSWGYKGQTFVVNLGDRRAAVTIDRAHEQPPAAAAGQSQPLLLLVNVRDAEPISRSIPMRDSTVGSVRLLNVESIRSEHLLMEINEHLPPVLMNPTAARVANVGPSSSNVDPNSH